MIVLDGTIVYVALPSIQEDLHLSQTSLAWVVNAFTLAYSGVLLLAGRLGDHYGHRKLFLIGLAAFTMASLVCGLGSVPILLIAGRAAQGLAGAVVSAGALSLIMEMFSDSSERAKALGIYGFICVGGGSAGLLLGGVLTSALSWHWIFLLNFPIGVAVYFVCYSRLPTDHKAVRNGRVDTWGAISITSALVFAVYAIVDGQEPETSLTKTLGLLGCAAVSFAAFVIIESRVQTPLMPLRFFRSSTMIVSNIVRMLWAAAGSTPFFVALHADPYSAESTEGLRKFCLSSRLLSISCWHCGTTVYALPRRIGLSRQQ